MIAHWKLGLLAAVWTFAWTSAGRAAEPATAPAPLAPLPAPVAPAAPVAPVAPVTQGIRVTALQPGGDVVYLQNGGFLRGSVVELFPGDHTTILGVDGQSRVIPWREIARIELGQRGPDGADATPIAPPAPTPATPIPAPKHGPLVRIHIESSRKVLLYRQSSDGGWQEACSSPCDEELPLEEEYRIAGPGIHQSGDFHLDGSPGDRIVLRVSAGSRAGVLTGGILASIGGAADYIGLIALAAGASCHSSYSSGYSSSSYGSGSYYGSSSCNGDTGATAAGAVLLIGGTILTVAGIVVMIKNASTSVSQSASNTSNTAFLRDPVFHSTSTEARSTGPAFIAPLSIKF